MRKTIWEQIVDKKDEWIGGVLQETKDSFNESAILAFGRPIMEKVSETKIVDIKLQYGNNSDWPVFTVVGKDYSCSFSTDVGGVVGKPVNKSEEGWLYLVGYGGHEFRIKQREEESKMKWKCHICGKERDDSEIAVKVTDASDRRGLPRGTIIENIRFCNDNPDCIEKSKTKQFIWESEKSADETEREEL